MASIPHSTLAFGGASASDYLRSSSNGVSRIPWKTLGRAIFTTRRRKDLAMTARLKKVFWCGEELLKKRDVVVAATSRELEGEGEQIQKANETFSEDEPSSEVLNEMIEKLKFEIDDEYTEAVKALGLEERLMAMREEFSKASVDPVLIEKIEKLKEEFNTRLSDAPNYKSLNSKLKMMKVLSRAKAESEATSLKREINKRFQPDIIEKFEAIKAEVASSGDELTDELREKILKTKAEVEAEMVSVVNSMGLEMEDVKPNVVEQTFVPNENLQGKLEKLNQEITEKIEEVVKSPEIKSMVELLKVETAKARQMQGVTEASQKIEMLEQQIKQKIAEALSMSGLQEKQEELENEIAAAEESEGSLKEDEDDEDGSGTGKREMVNPSFT